MNAFLQLMKPELALTAILFLLLFIKIGKGLSNDKLLGLVQLLLLLNFIGGFFFVSRGVLFGDLYFTNPTIILEKNILNLALYLISLIGSEWFKKSEHLAEYFMLMIAATLGFFLLLSSGNMLMFYLSLELATIPVAAMANFDLHRKRSSEGAMKMILSSAFSSGLFLFGVSLLYGSLGTLNLSAISEGLNGSSLQILAFVFIFAAFAFKLSIVPFHLWTADVYEGSPIPTTAFLSVVSKGTIAFVFMRFVFYIFQPLYGIWYVLLIALALLTLIIGNLFALRQQNIKRFLAFSSIAQVGFILVGIISNNTGGFAAVTYFILVYIFSNLAAFGVATAIAQALGKENIDDFKGLYQTNPFLSWIMALALFSLAGIPPTAGFFGKLFLLTAGGSNAAYWFIIIAALNMIVSLFYYLRVVRAIFMDKNETPIEKIHLSAATKLGLVICAAGVVAAGVYGPLYDYIAHFTN